MALRFRSIYCMHYCGGSYADMIDQSIYLYISIVDLSHRYVFMPGCQQALRLIAAPTEMSLSLVWKILILARFSRRCSIFKALKVPFQKCITEFAVSLIAVNGKNSKWHSGGDGWIRLYGQF